jgi:hypothetical protein
MGLALTDRGNHHSMDSRAFRFDVSDRLRPWSRLFLVHPELASVRIEDGWFSAWFGRWAVTTPVANIDDVSITGPFDWWKVAGPAHLSIADRGLTFATTDRRGVCVSFAEPVAGLDPLGAVRHPGLTVTVAEPDELVAAIGEAKIADMRASDEPPDGLQRAGWYATARSIVSWHRRGPDETHHRQRLVPQIALPPMRTVADADAQPFADGAGPAFHRRYRVEIADATRSAPEAIDQFCLQLDRAIDESLSPVTKIDGSLHSFDVGDRFVLSLAGPWSAPVEVVHHEPCSFRFATLRGHLEAGVIDFSAREVGDHLEFTIESWARNGDRPMQFLYDVVGVARSLQAELWVRTCERFVSVSGGRRSGPIDVLTERAR